MTVVPAIFAAFPSWEVGELVGVVQFVERILAVLRVHETPPQQSLVQLLSDLVRVQG